MSVSSQTIVSPANVFHLLPDSYLLLSPDLRILDVSEAYLKATMTQRQTLIGQELLEMFPNNPDDPHTKSQAAVRESIETAIRTKTTQHLPQQQYDIRRPASAGGGFEERFWSIRTIPILSPEGDITSLIHRIEDITANVRTQQTLVRATARNSEILESLTDAFFALDNEWRFTYFNAAAEKLLGHSRSTVLGQSIWKLYPEARGTVVENQYRRVFTEQRPVEFESFNARLNIFFSIKAYPIREGGIAVYFHDVTERRRNEEERGRLIRELQEARALLNIVFEKAPVGLAILDLEQRFLRLNETLAQFNGYSISAHIGRTIDDLLPGLFPNASKVFETMRNTLSPVLNQEVTSRKPAAAGQERTSSVSYFPIILGDTLAGIGMVAEDISLHKQYQVKLERAVAEQTADLQRKEQELAQSRKMEAVGRLAGGIAHDFNNLLTGIFGCALELEEQISGSPEQLVEVQEIRKAAERASALTKQLLTFSRQQVVKPRDLDLNHQVGETVSLLRRVVGEHIIVDARLDTHDIKVHMDPTQIDQILLNLSINARDAMPDGGKLLIKTSKIIIDEMVPHIELKKGMYAMMSIIDTGHGMNKEILAQIFEPFFTTKEMGKGTGLGLATVYGIIQQNQGGITVFSDSGVGSVFKIFLPALDDENRSNQPPVPHDHDASVQRALHAETILLVEDEELVANHVARILKRQGYQVLVARSGEDALRQFDASKQKIDLVLTDVIMPGMNGRQLVEALRGRQPDLKALYMSGYPAEVISERGILASGIEFIEKPFYPSALFAKVRELLD